MDVALARLAISLVDLTDLTNDCTDAAIDALCERALARRDGGRVRVARLRGPVGGAARGLTGVRVATVVNFPTRRRAPVRGRCRHRAGPRRRRRRDRRRAPVPRLRVGPPRPPCGDARPRALAHRGSGAHEGDPRDRRAPRPRHDRARSPVRRRARRRLHQDLDRQVAGVGHPAGGRDDAARDPRRRPPGRHQAVGWHQQGRRRGSLHRRGRADHGGRLGVAGHVPVRCERPAQLAARGGGRRAHGGGSRARPTDRVGVSRRRPRASRTRRAAPPRPTRRRRRRSARSSR